MHDLHRLRFHERVRVVVGFYKHDIPAWRGGTAALSDRAYRVYHVLVEQIMLYEGPVPAHERTLAGLSNRSVRDLKAALDELVRAGKISIADGLISNGRAGRELESVRNNRANAGKGGRQLRERSATSPREVDERSASTRREGSDANEKPNDINDTNGAPLQHVGSLKEKRREEENTPFSPQGGGGGPGLFEPEPDPAEPDRFPEFWDVYPKREGGNPRKPAEDSYRRAVRKGALQDAIIRGARNYAAMMVRTDRVGTSYVAQAATWLNQQRWQDDYRATAPPRVAATQAFRV